MVVCGFYGWPLLGLQVFIHLLHLFVKVGVVGGP